MPTDVLPRFVTTEAPTKAHRPAIDLSRVTPATIDQCRQVLGGREPMDVIRSASVTPPAPSVLQ